MVKRLEEAASFFEQRQDTASAWTFSPSTANVVAQSIGEAARLLSSQNVGAREVVVEKNDLRNFGEALLCAEYAITNPRSDQQFALVAVRAALADLNAAAMLAKGKS